MIGDSYFQLRAQVGTALFSVLRLARETAASEPVVTALAAAQESLRGSFLLLTLGPAGSGKSTFLNSLFDREFCGRCEPGTAARSGVYLYAEEPRDAVLSAGIVECHRPCGFLRDFTVVDAPGGEMEIDPAASDLAPYVARADVIFFVIAAGETSAATWSFLARLGRDTLKRTVFVVGPNERALPGEAAQSVKRLRQAMLKNLGQACPIFTAAGEDRVGREKLVRWVESEVIFSTPRRAHLLELDRLAEEALREVAAAPRAAQERWRVGAEKLQRLQERLGECEEQSERQIAGALWAMAQSFDTLRAQAEARLRASLRLLDFGRSRVAWIAELARVVEAEAQREFRAQIGETLAHFETELREAEAEHRAVCCDALGEELPGDSPVFPRTEIATAALEAERPLELKLLLEREIAAARRLLLLPFFAALGSVAIVLGALPMLGFVSGATALAAGAIGYTLLLALLLRERIVAIFGAHLTANRQALLTTLKAQLEQAATDFFAEMKPPLEGRLSVHRAERHRHEPPLARIAQLEETFTRIAAALRSNALAALPAADPSAAPD